MLPCPPQKRDKHAYRTFLYILKVYNRGRFTVSDVREEVRRARWHKEAATVPVRQSTLAARTQVGLLLCDHDDLLREFALFCPSS